jgi:hypothetical protein
LNCNRKFSAKWFVLENLAYFHRRFFPAKLFNSRRGKAAGWHR